MFAKTLFVLVVAAGCTKAGPPNETPPGPDKNTPGVAIPEPAPPPPPPPAPAPPPPPTPAAATTVTLTSVTFADDCGGEPPWTAPTPPKPSPSRFSQPPARSALSAPGSMVAPGAARAAPAKRRCQQTSLQLDIVAGGDTDVKIKTVQVSDETGKLLGALATSTPRRWSEKAAAYEAWDGKVTKSETAQVTYVLQRPSFVSFYESRTRTYSVKVVALVGGVEETKTTSVMIVARPAPVPT